MKGRNFQGTNIRHTLGRLRRVDTYFEMKSHKNGNVIVDVLQ